jgi:transposase
MRGDDVRQGSMFSYVSLEQRVPESHPLRPLRAMVDEALVELSPAFEGLYSRVGRPSIPPEKLLRALLLQVLYTVRSERMLMEQLDYNLLFRWFVGLGMDDAAWVPTVFSKNRDRLPEGDIAREFFERVLAQAKKRRLLSSEHFTVDGTLIEAWAGQKSFRPKEESGGSPPDDPGNPTVDFHGEKRSNATHQSSTDPDAKLFKKGKGREAKLSYMGHVLRGCLESLGRRAKIRRWDTPVTSATRNGGSSVVCFRLPSEEGDPARQNFGRSSMPSSTSCAVAALGACSPKTSPLSRRSTCTSSSGETTGLGRGSMTCFETASGGLKGARRVPVQQSWIAKV